jgi:iron complex transport system ATP-binding protein
VTSLRTVDLSLAYGAEHVLRDVSVEIPEGRVTVIVGANASGKTTLLRGLARMLRPTTGLVLLDGKDIHSRSSKYVATVMGLLPQDAPEHSGLTVTELVYRGRTPHRRGLLGGYGPQDEQAVRRAIALTGLEPVAGRAVDDLSGGQRRRAWIAMALAQETEILLLDEPTAFLDVANEVEVLDLLTDLNRREGTTMVLVLHDLNLAARYADHLVALKDGEVARQGAPAEVLTERFLTDVFGLRARIVLDPVSRTPLIVPIGRHHSYAAIDCRYPIGRDPGARPAPVRMVGEPPGLRPPGEPVD